MMKKIIITITIPFLLASIALFYTAQPVNAQNNQEVKTQVGNPAEDEDGGGAGGGARGGADDGLSAGVFKIPFECRLKYWSWTYSGHSPWSVDINRGSGATDKGDRVNASADGVVWDRINSNGQVVIRHDGDFYSLYAHMINIQVNEGQRVSQGQKIGEIGDTGAPGQWHLHVNHSKGSPYTYSNRIRVCYIGYGCNAASVYSNTRIRYGTDYDNGC